jgi:hypothetical protein
LFWYHLLHPNPPWCRSLPPLFRSCLLNTYAICLWKTSHMVKLQHLDLSCNLGVTSTFRWVGLKPTMNFPSGPRSCRPRLPSFVFMPNYRLV